MINVVIMFDYFLIIIIMIMIMIIIIIVIILLMFITIFATDLNNILLLDFNVH